MKGVSRLATLARGLSKGFLLKSSRFLPVLVLTSSSERNVNHFFSTVFCLSFPAPAILHAILKRLHQVHNLAGLRGLEFKIVFFELVGFGKQPVGCPKQCFTVSRRKSMNAKAMACFAASRKSALVNGRLITIQ